MTSSFAVAYVENNILCDCWEIYSWSTGVFKGEPNQRRITGPIHRDGIYIYMYKVPRVLAGAYKDLQIEFAK